MRACYTKINSNTKKYIYYYINFDRFSRQIYNPFMLRQGSCTCLGRNPLLIISDATKAFANLLLDEEVGQLFCYRISSSDHLFK